MAKSSSLWEHIKGRWREFKREPSALFFVVFMPILWMTILGFAFSGEKHERFSIGWVDGPLKGQATALATRQRLIADEHVRFVRGSREKLDLDALRGDVVAILSFENDQATVTYDASNKQALDARKLIEDHVQRAAGRTDPATIADNKISLPGQRYIDFLVPGLLALSIMTSSLFGTGMTIVSNRRENLLKRYLATPMRPLEYIVSHIVGRGMILAVEMATILIASFLIFRFKVHGNILEFVLFAALGTAAFTALAILCAARTGNAATMNGATNLVSLPMMILSGVWFARTNFPDWLAGGVRYLPLAPLVDGLRKIALEGAGLTSLGFEAAVLGCYLVVCSIAATAVFKWYT